MTSWLVVGLGNPGPTYASTRHNVGFLVADELARRARANWSAPKGMRADVCETVWTPGGLGVPGTDPQRVVLAKPRTFMNEAGIAVARLAGFHRIDPAHVIAIHDELDLEPGQLRLKSGGGDNGHNGLKSLRSHLGTGDFLRVRFGIGRPPGRQDPADFVLAQIPASVRPDIDLEVQRAADAVEALLADGLDVARNRFNS